MALYAHRTNAQTSYEHKQWAIDPNREKDTPNNKLLDTSSASGRTTIDPEAKVEDGPIIIEEITKMKNNRSPGPGRIPVEPVKLLHDEGLELVRDILNNCWGKEVRNEASRTGDAI